jgi:uncharacterized delta-60 repeat protein
MTSVCWGQSYWKRTYGGNYPEQMLFQPDGSVLILGSKAPSSADYDDIWIIKGNSLGDILWSKTYGGSSYDNPRQILSQSDGTSLILGYTNSYGTAKQDIWLLKINSEGDTLWTKTYGGSNYDYPTEMLLQPDGSILILGYTDSFGAGNKDIWLLKVNSFGDTLWTKTFGGIHDDVPVKMLLQSDGSILVLGVTNLIFSDVAPIGDILLFKVNSSGNTLWTKIYGESGYNSPTQMLLQSDGSMLITGITNFNGAENQSIWLLKVNSVGDTLWTKTYGGIHNSNPTQMILQPDSSILILGQTNYFLSDVNSSRNIYLLKANSLGDTLWTKIYGGVKGSSPTQMQLQPDSSILILGTTNLFLPGGGDIMLLKVNSFGDTLWTKKYGGAGVDFPTQMLQKPDGSIFILGFMASYGTSIWSVINDQYAYKDINFFFKIPGYSDSLNQIHEPIKVPSGMKVSAGGTVFWTPKTDSIYMEHAEFLVTDANGRKDTLTFNIFVNSSYYPVAIKPISHLLANKNKPFSIVQTSSSQIKFKLPAVASSVDIYDINGRCVQRLKPVDAQVVWNGLNTAGRPVSSGRYFVKIKDGTNSRMAEFSVVK